MSEGEKKEEKKPQWPTFLSVFAVVALLAAAGQQTRSDERPDGTGTSQAVVGELVVDPPTETLIDGRCIKHLTAFDIAGARELWTTSIQADGGRPTPVGDVVISTGWTFEEQRSIVVAHSITDGHVAWQREIYANQTTVAAASEQTIVLSGVLVDPTDQGFSESSVDFRVDGAGTVTVNEQPIRAQPGLTDPGLAAVGSPIEFGSARPITSADGRYQLLPDAGVVRTVATGETVDLRVLHDEVYNSSQIEASIGQAGDVDAEHALIVLGSYQGPNVKVSLYDRATGEGQWTMENVRMASLAGDYVIYDQRNDNPVDAEVTRTLYLAPVGEPTAVVWKTDLSVNDGGGNGYLGMREGRLLFAVATTDRASGVGVLEIGPDGTPPPVLVAAEGFGGRAGPFVLDQDLLILAVDQDQTGILLVPTEGERRFIPFAESVEWLGRSGNTLLALSPGSGNNCFGP